MAGWMIGRGAELDGGRLLMNGGLCYGRVWRGAVGKAGEVDLGPYIYLRRALFSVLGGMPV
jgi:hypothetical protein